MSGPVLFLDVDGVLNHAAHFKLYRPKFGSDVLDPACVQALRGVVLGTDVQVVLSSTWRLIPTARRLIEVVLHTHGIPVFGDTPDSCSPAWTGSTTARGDEIAAWLREHPEVQVYAIVDDDTDAGEGHAPERFVQTDWEGGGLTFAKAADLRRALGLD